MDIKSDRFSRKNIIDDIVSLKNMSKNEGKINIFESNFKLN